MPRHEARAPRCLRSSGCGRDRHRCHPTRSSCWTGPRRSEPVRTFGTFTGDLHRLADWFKQCGVSTVAMESTGVYWIPVFEILEQLGFTVVLVNARDAKHVPGRKTDVTDAQWLQRLHEYGLLRASFRPQAEIAALRDYLRQRERLLDYAASHIQHMQKALMQMNLQLHHVVTDITGATGMRSSVPSWLASATRVLAAFRDRRCKESSRRSDRHWSAMTGRNTSSPWRRPWSCMTSTWPRLLPATSGLRRS